MKAAGIALVTLLYLLSYALQANAGNLILQGTNETIDLLDRPLVDAGGGRHRFVTDLVQTRRSLLSFTFAGCAAQCPLSDAVMDIVAETLRAKGTTDVSLLTVTLDPLSDTPAVLQAERASRLHPDRVFLTGDPTDVFRILAGLGIEGGANADHISSFLLLDPELGSFSRFDASADADTLLGAVNRTR